MNSIEKELLKLIDDSFDKEKIGRNVSLIAACSGGPDSTALLYLLSRWNELRRMRLSAVYIDHGLRSPEEIEREITILTENAGSWNVPAEIRRISNGFLSYYCRKKGLSVEDAARIFRYRKIRRLAEKNKDRGYIIVTGHTAEDQAETLLIRFLQGSSCDGLQGMREYENRIWRPLLHCRKDKLISLLGELNIPFSEDSTNTDNTFLRNKIRSELLPVVKKICPGFYSSMENMTKKNRELALFLEHGLDNLQWKRTENGEMRINKDDFFSVPALLRIRSFYKAFDILMSGRIKQGYRLPYRFLKPLSGDPANDREGIILKGHGIVFRISGDFLFLQHDENRENDQFGYSFELPVDKDVSFNGRIYRMAGESASGEPPVLFFRKTEIRHPVILRSFREGDVIIVNSRKKNLKKIFSEWNICRSGRSCVPVVSDRRGILAILGEKAGGKNICSDHIKFPINGDFFNIFLYIVNN